MAGGFKNLGELYQVQCTRKVMGYTEMSTTRFRGETDKGDKVRHAHGRPHYEICVNYRGEIGLNGWPAGSNI